MNMQSSGVMCELEKISYSKISTFEQCPLRFFKKYEEKKRSNLKTLALEIGTITHYGKELIGLALMKGEKPDYELIKEIVMSGYDEEIEKAFTEDGELLHDEAEHQTKAVRVLGLRELKEKYFFEWVEKDNKSGMDYDEKLKIYFDNLQSLELDASWKPVACELKFDFPYIIDNEEVFRLYGFIDRVDISAAGEYRVVDYKSSKKIFDEKYTKTPLQMFMYTLAVEHVFGKIPISHVYDFMLLGRMQDVCSKGYYKRGTDKLAKLWRGLQECRENSIWPAKPTPLCHWCDYCKTNKSTSEELSDECPYYSLWTPNNKTFEVNKKYEEGTLEIEKKASGFWF